MVDHSRCKAWRTRTRLVFEELGASKIGLPQPTYCPVLRPNLFASLPAWPGSPNASRCKSARLLSCDAWLAWSPNQVISCAFAVHLPACLLLPQFPLFLSLSLSLHRRRALYAGLLRQGVYRTQPLRRPQWDIAIDWKTHGRQHKPNAADENTAKRRLRGEGSARCTSNSRRSKGQPIACQDNVLKACVPNTLAISLPPSLRSTARSLVIGNLRTGAKSVAPPLPMLQALAA